MAWQEKQDQPSSLRTGLQRSRWWSGTTKPCRPTKSMSLKIKRQQTSCSSSGFSPSCPGELIPTPVLAVYLRPGSQLFHQGRCFKLAKQVCKCLPAAPQPAICRIPTTVEASQKEWQELKGQWAKRSDLHLTEVLMYRSNCHHHHITLQGSIVSCS